MFQTVLSSCLPGAGFNLSALKYLQEDTNRLWLVIQLKRNV